MQAALQWHHTQAAKLSDTGTHLLLLLVTRPAPYVLRNVLSAHAHAVAPILLDLTDGGAQLCGVGLEALELELAHDGGLLRLLALPCFALLQLGQPGAVLLQEVVHVALFRDLLMQAAPHHEQNQHTAPCCRLPVAHFSYVLAMLPALVQAWRLHVVQLTLRPCAAVERHLLPAGRRLEAALHATIAAFCGATHLRGLAASGLVHRAIAQHDAFVVADGRWLVAALLGASTRAAVVRCINTVHAASHAPRHHDILGHRVQQRWGGGGIPERTSDSKRK